MQSQKDLNQDARLTTIGNLRNISDYTLSEASKVFHKLHKPTFKLVGKITTLHCNK